MISNFPLNPEDSIRSDHIYGLDRPLLQVGMKCCIKPTRRVPRVTLLTDILLHHKNIKLYSDYFNMNVIPFLHTKSPKINFLTAENCTSNIMENIIK